MHGSKLRAASSVLAVHLAACLSLGSAFVHLWAAPEHFSEWWGYGAVFVLLALAQGMYGVALLRWPTRPLFLLGVGGNLSIVALYVVTRTAGVPFVGPHAWHPEEVAALDLTATSAELVLVATLVWLARAISVARIYLALGFALALASGLVLHLAQAPAHESQALGVAPHSFIYAALSTPLAILAVWVSTSAARAVISWFDPDSSLMTAAHRAAWALTVSSAYAMLGAATGEFAGRYAEAGTLAIQIVRDAGVILPTSFALLFAVASLRGAPWETPRRMSLWRPRAATVLAAGAASVALLAGPSILEGGFSSPAEAQQVPAAAGCSANSYDRSYDVAAINVRIPYNRWGDLDPHGQAFVLQGDKQAVKNWSTPLAANPADDPAGNRRLRPRPLVIRANAGECVKVDFTNELDEVGGDGLPNDPRASMKVFGPSYDAQTSDGSAVGYNEDTTVSNNPGENKISYFWQAPDSEGMFMFRDQGATAGSEANSGSLSHGLFGAFVVEPAGSVWRDPETGEPLYAGGADHSRITKESGDPYIDADIVSPGEPAFRETVQLSQDELPAGIGFGFNYGAEPQRNREANRGPDSLGEETSLSSWVYGDPALIKLASGEGPWKPKDPEDPAIEDCGLEEEPGGSCYVSNVAHSYPGDPTKVRFANAGVKETHVFHMHAHQWLAEPEDVGNSGAASGEITDANRPESTTIDSQTFGPGESFTAELLYGAGSKPGTFGDSIFHCHLYPHFADGFWSLFRVHDVLEDGTKKTPDGINVRRLVPLPDTTAPPEPTADNPGYPRFIPGKFGWRAPQPPDEISQTNPNATDDPDTVEREDLDPATRIVAGRLLDATLDPSDPVEEDLAERLALEERVQNFNYTGDANQQADVEAGAPFRNPCPSGSREVTYNVSVIQRDIVYNERGDHDTQGRILVLDKDVDDVLAGRKEPEPLFTRVNAGDCVTWNLTNRLPNWIGNDAFQSLQQTNMIGQHIHLVKFDVLGSDGSSNGWNYQQAAFTREQTDFNQNLDADGNVENCDEATGCRLQNPPDWDPTTTSEGLQPGQTITERWFADYELRTVFTHDHHFAAVDQNRGLFGGLIVEPRGMDYRNPRTGEFYQPGSGNVSNAPTCGSSCEGTAAGEAMDVIGPGASDDFREFGLAAQDFVPLTRAGGDPQNPDDVINPPFAPEAFPDDDPGTMAINYRNAPFQLRQEKNGRPVDPAYTFSSSVWGDPETPLLEAYSEDPVRIRAIQGSQEEQHVLKINGMRWREEPDDPESPLVSSQDVGVSEAFNFEVPRIVCGPNDGTCAGDYLYSSTTADDMYLGMWGLLRARGQQVPSLLPLPDNANPNEPTSTSAPTSTTPAPAGEPLSSTGLAPPEANAPGTPCPSGTPIKKYNVVAMQTELEYNKYGDNDPYGLMYALAEDEAAIRAGEKEPEPLVLRANEGDCIEVRLTNRLTPAFLGHNGIQDGDAEVPTEPASGTPAGLRVSLSPQIVRYDVRGSDGTAVGYNRDQTVAPGDSKLYRWFADDAGVGEIGATNLLDYGDVRGHRHHGLFAGLMIEPRGATYHDPRTGEEIQSGASADIRVPGPDNDFREFSLFYQDGLNLRDSSGEIIEDPADHPPTTEPPDPAEPPEAPEEMDAEDQGEKGFNYANAPFDHRIGAVPETGMDGQTMSSVFSSTATSPLTGEAQGDPDTPIFRAFAGDDVRMRVLQGADKPRQNTFQISGHSWRAQPDDPDSTTIGNQGGISVGRAFNANLSSSAAPGDYLYGTGIHGFQLWGGLWGIMRLYPQLPLAEALNPTAIPTVDDPRAGGHPILPLEVGENQSAVSLTANPASVDAGGSTALSGSLEIPGVGGLSGREVVIERRPEGASAWQSVAGGTLTTGGGGSFTLENVSPSRTTDYRATFAGQPGIGVGGATSQPVRVEVKVGVSIGLSTSASSVVYGQSATLSGSLASDDALLSGERVVIEQKPHGEAGFAPVPGQPSGGVLTDANGKFELPGVRPEKNTEYRAVFAGGAGLAASESATVEIGVKVLVSVETSPASVKVGKFIVISGDVKPAHEGKVRVTIRGGPKTVVKAVALSGSRYSFRYKLPRAGRYTVSVSFAGDADHLENMSPAKPFRVVR